ncbi:MAG: hypothetical protein PHS34_07570 [Candidatus Omnitrophica bacterium]|nr:hypothetical protein [Candidatus Omnitrophota bacterium]
MVEIYRPILPTDKNKKGEKFKIIGINNLYGGIYYYGAIKSNDELISGWLEKELRLVKKGKPTKVNYLLQYELENDPIEEFETIKQVEERIKELAEDKNLQEDSIVLYKIASVKHIKIKREVVIEGL